jgi:hypothetical protein
MRIEALQITDVKTLLFLLSELIWIKGEDKGMFAFLKGYSESWLDYQYSVLTSGIISREFVLNDLSGAPFEMRPCLRKKPGK